MEIISSHDIEDVYLTNVVSVSKLLRLSTKIEMKYLQALNKQIHNAERNAILNERNYYSQSEFFQKTFIRYNSPFWNIKIGHPNCFINIESIKYP